MTEILARFSPGELIGLIATMGGLLLAIVTVIAVQWHGVRLAEMETSLKQQMLEKGMSPAEIEQVMKANRESPDPGVLVSTGNEAQNKAALVQRMLDGGYEGEDIERVLKAYQTGAKPAEEKTM